jgi:hypothetical protein
VVSFLTSLGDGTTAVSGQELTKCLLGVSVLYLSAVLYHGMTPMAEASSSGSSMDTKESMEQD